MRKTGIICGVLILVLAPFANTRQIHSQTDNTSLGGAAPYRLSISVDEVILTFNATDARGLSIDDLRLNELNLLDNGVPPLKILAFQYMQDVPIRAGILMDLSESMDQSRSTDRAIAIKYAQQLLRRKTDQAFVVNFGRRPTVAQPWTADAYALVEGIRNRNVPAGGGIIRNNGTAVIDAVYRACHDQFGYIDYSASGNFVLLFSDGEDNASSYSLQDAVGMCQRTNAAVYAFRAEAESGLSSAGPKILADLATQTGGRVFHDDDSEAEISNDLRIIETDLHNHYRLVYKPADLKRNGSFHRIALIGPERVARIDVRSGYYAPTH